MESLSSWIVIRRLRWPFLVIVLTFSISILGMVLIPGQDDQGNVYHLNFFDAFYFVSYMASTIGFGESPYAFTYPQKLWVSFNIYLTVIGWFYGIGTIVALIQDEVLHKELARTAFARAVKSIKEPFVLILGYNNATKELIRKLSETDIRMVVLDRDQQAINALILENYHPNIPAYSGNVLDSEVLKLAGVRLKNCRSVVMLFENDEKNTKLSLMCKHLNKHVELIVRSGSIPNGDFLKTIGVEHVENPFKVISSRLHLSLTAPHLWLLEMWIHGHILKIKRREILPSGHYIIYGYGRMGKALEKGLKKAGVVYTFIDARESSLGRSLSETNELCREDEIEEKLLNANIQKAALIIAGTRDDIINLAVITLAKKHNPDIYTISRENEMNGMHMFQSARVQRHYVLEQIIIDKTYNYLAMPLANTFIEILNRKDEAWGKALVERIVSKMGERPMLCEIEINEASAYAAYHKLLKGLSITAGMLKRKREDYTLENRLIFLMILRDNEPIILPENEYEIKIGDKMLIVCEEESKEDLEYILENYYELYYVMNGKESRPGLFLT
ncbi:TrkA family potassium uptake protein [Sulfurovum sp.]|uniref:potassium channel family protein n=1 Tax=Sulfurovum sp. TaxID=1969726 RepID=UPI0025D848CA|nr:potassium channel protein [Sulfurovum sp.]